MSSTPLFLLFGFTEKKMKVLYIITGLGLGGAEKVVTELADALTDEGHQVQIAYLTGNVEVKPQSNEIEIIYLGLESTYYLFPAIKKLKKLIEQFQPDVVHSHMVHANIFARLCRLNIPMKKLICTAHSTNEGGTFRMFLYRLTAKLADINSNVSNEATDRFIAKKAFSTNAITTYNGINLTKFVFQKKSTLHSSKKLQLISVGRLKDAKDYPNLLHALTILIKTTTIDFHLKIVGEGEDQQSIENLTQQLNLENHVELLGRRDDIPNLLHQADIFILSSRYEGLPTVLIEAMACGCFVVATDCGGVKEVMGGTGILVPPNNSDALANAIISALQMTEKDILTNNQKALIHIQENFDLKTIAKKWLSIYEQ